MDNSKESYFFSVIITAYNAESTIEAALTSIFSSDFNNFEVIVVDDGSCDNTVPIAGRFPCKVLNLKKNSGAAAARNEGVKVAVGDIIIFIDSDVVVQKDILNRFDNAFKKNTPDAVVGIYGREQFFANPFSVYKNLFLHFNQNNNNPRFWSGCAAIKRDIFLKFGGFNEERKGALAEDTELGYLLYNNNCKIEVRRDIQVAHNHRYGLASLIKNDFLKTVEWSKLLVRKGAKIKTGKYYLNTKNILSLICVFAIILLLLFVFTKSFLFFIWLCISLAIFTILNINFYRLLVREAGLKYLFLGPLLHVLSYIIAFSGLSYGFFTMVYDRKRVKNG